MGKKPMNKTSHSLTFISQFLFESIKFPADTGQYVKWNQEFVQTYISILANIPQNQFHFKLKH